MSNFNFNQYEPMSAHINMEKTGKNIKRLIKERGYAMHYIMAKMGIMSEQAIYKWYSGKALPSPDNMVILSLLLGVTINDLLVIDIGEEVDCF